MMQKSGYVIIVYLLLFSVFTICPSAVNGHDPLYAPDRGKIVRLDVSGPGEITQMFENVLTENGFILLDDPSVPVVAVKAEKSLQGSRRTRLLSYHITNLTIQTHDGRLLYSSPAKFASYSGDDTSVSAGAISLLKQYIVSDKAFMTQLNDIPLQNYYTLEVATPAGQEQDESIRKALMAISGKLVSADEIERIAKQIDQNYESLKHHFDLRMQHITENLKTHSGSGGFILPERTVDEISMIVRRHEIPYRSLQRCKEAASIDYTSVQGVLIRVPVANLPIAPYRIFSDSNLILFKKQETQGGPLLFPNENQLLNSSLGRYFSNSKYFVELHAISYCHDDMGIILSECDAEKLDSYLKKGSAARVTDNGDRVFRQRRVVLIPDY